MDPRLLAIEQDKVIRAGAAAAAERQDAQESALFNKAARTNVHFDAPWNKIFKIVFFPDRIYHAQYLNATRSPRYQYNVLEVRSRADFIVLKAEVYLTENSCAMRCASSIGPDASPSRCASAGASSATRCLSGWS